MNAFDGGVVSKTLASWGGLRGETHGSAGVLASDDASLSLPFAARDALEPCPDLDFSRAAIADTFDRASFQSQAAVTCRFAAAIVCFFPVA